MTPPSPRPREAGYSLVALLASLTIMMILMGAGSSTWKYIMKDDREQELIYRGQEIADALKRYQDKNGNALPTSLEVMVKAKCLRHAYKDPMTKDGKWHFVHQGEAVGAMPGGLGGPGGPGGGPGGRSGQPGSGPGAGSGPGSGSGLPGSDTEGTPSTTTPTTRPSSFGSLGGQTMGPIMGVRSNSTDKSLRMVNGRTKYSEWVFLAGQTVTVGKPATMGPQAPQSPGATPRPTPVPTPTPLR